MHIDVWGALRVAGDGRVLGPRDFTGAKPKQLLEILAVERGHTVSKSRLADLLWGGGLPPKYQATLETYISVLRQTLEPGVRARDSVILTERGGYRLDAERTTLDLEEFDLLVASAAGQEPVAALGALNAALVLVRGQVLEDEPYAVWSEQLRSTCSQKHLQVLIDAGRLSLVNGQVQAALGLAEQAVVLNPLAEGAYRVLMAAAYRLGRQGDALRAFDRCRGELADELGVDPMQETADLHLAILRHDPLPVPAQRLGASDVVVAVGQDETVWPSHLQSAVGQAADGRFTLLLQVLEGCGVDQLRLAEALLARVDPCSDVLGSVPAAYSPAVIDLRQPARSNEVAAWAAQLANCEAAFQAFHRSGRGQVLAPLPELVRGLGLPSRLTIPSQPKPADSRMDADKQELPVS